MRSLSMRYLSGKILNCIECNSSAAWGIDCLILILKFSSLNFLKRKACGLSNKASMVIDTQQPFEYTLRSRYRSFGIKIYV
jgi:hypothetical protein